MYTTKSERILAIILHLSGFLNGAMPIVVPLLIWILKKRTSYFIDAHEKAALNFQISVLVLGLLATLFMFFTIGLGAIIVVPLGLIFVCLYVYFIISAAIASNKGLLYKYPFSWSFLR